MEGTFVVDAGGRERRGGRRQDHAEHGGGHRPTPPPRPQPRLHPPTTEATDSFRAKDDGEEDRTDTLAPQFLPPLHSAAAEGNHRQSRRAGRRAINQSQC
jgi:hypothetical protein